AVAAASTLFFTVLYGGNLFDCLTAAFCGFLVQLLSSSIKRPDIYRFAISLLGGIVIAAIAVGATAIAGTGSIDKIIVGAIIPLLPGLAMTNAIRDTIMGDLVSGIARLAEVMLTAVSLAGGVGVVLSLYVYLGGAI
ncbi:MAG: threonine/serine exporter family protein, partial [Eubacteriales bacterium]